MQSRRKLQPGGRTTHTSVPRQQQQHGQKLQCQGGGRYTFVLDRLVTREKSFDDRDMSAWNAASEATGPAKRKPAIPAGAADLAGWYLFRACVGTAWQPRRAPPALRPMFLLPHVSLLLLLLLLRLPPPDKANTQGEYATHTPQNTKQELPGKPYHAAAN